MCSPKDRVLPVPLICMGGPAEDVARTAGRAAIPALPGAVAGGQPSGLARQCFLSALPLFGETHCCLK